MYDGGLSVLTLSPETLLMFCWERKERNLRENSREKAS